MIGQRIILGKVLERWSASVFLAAGGLLLVTTAINGVDVVTPIDTQEGVLLWLEGLTGFGGVVLTFVGLLGLYSRLSNVAPRLARTGTLLAVGPTMFFTVVLVFCAGLAPALGYPSLKTLVPSFVTIATGTLLPFALALTLFGIGSLRTAMPSRSVGGFLLVIAAAWFVFFGATWVYAPHTPVWVTFVQTSMMAVPTVAIGYHLRTDTGWAHHAASSDVTTA